MQIFWADVVIVEKNDLLWCNVDESWTKAKWKRDDAKWYCILGGATKSCVNLNFLRVLTLRNYVVKVSNRKQIMNVEWSVSPYNIWFNL